MRKRRNVENFLTKDYKKKLKMEANLESNKVLFEKDPDPTTILIWWSPEERFPPVRRGLNSSSLASSRFYTLWRFSKGNQNVEKF